MTTNNLVDLLTALEEEWRRQGAPIADLLAPGLTDQDIDALVDPVGLRLPQELRVWWRWHDGLAHVPDAWPEGSIGPGDWHPMSLREAVDRYREELPDRPDPAGDLYWRATWFPFAIMSNDVLFVDTAATSPDGEAAPVRYRAWFGWFNYEVDQAPSLTATVQKWLRALREGYFWWEPREHVWLDRIGELPADLQGDLI